jgi:hypothetical protein
VATACREVAGARRCCGLRARDSSEELRSLQGRLAYIRRFIANFAGRIEPFTRLTKKDGRSSLHSLPTEEASLSFHSQPS